MNPAVRESAKVAGRVAGRAAAMVASTVVGVVVGDKVMAYELRWKQRGLKKMARAYAEGGRDGLKVYLFNNRIVHGEAHADLFIKQTMPALEKLIEIERKRADFKAAEKAAKEEKKAAKKAAKKAEKEAKQEASASVTT
jgi:hypothetical protein